MKTKPKFIKEKNEPKLEIKQTESVMQQHFFLLIKTSLRDYAPYFLHVPNGGKMSVITGKKLKNMGVKSGVADVLLMYAIGNYGGLWIEFKSGNNKQTVTQIEFEKLTATAGANGKKYAYSVCYSVLEALNVCRRYLTGNYR